MKIRYLIFLMITLPFFDGCAAYQRMSRKDDCEKVIKNYSRMIRWQEAEKASILYVDSKQRQLYDQTAERLRSKGIAWGDYRILSMQCLPDKLKAEATVEFDYFILPDNRMKTVTDHQIWRYRDEKTADPDLGEGWKLISPPPDFR